MRVEQGSLFANSYSWTPKCLLNFSNWSRAVFVFWTAFQSATAKTLICFSIKKKSLIKAESVKPHRCVILLIQERCLEYNKMRLFCELSFQLGFQGSERRQNVIWVNSCISWKCWNNVQHDSTTLFDRLPVHRNSYSLLIKIPRGHQICTGKVGGIKPPSSLGEEIFKKASQFFCLEN